MKRSFLKVKIAAIAILSLVGLSSVGWTALADIQISVPNINCGTGNHVATINGSIDDRHNVTGQEAINLISCISSVQKVYYTGTAEQASHFSIYSMPSLSNLFSQDDKLIENFENLTRNMTVHMRLSGTKVGFGEALFPAHYVIHGDFELQNDGRLFGSLGDNQNTDITIAKDAEVRLPENLLDDDSGINYINYTIENNESNSRVSCTDGICTIARTQAEDSPFETPQNSNPSSPGDSNSSSSSSESGSANVESAPLLPQAGVGTPITLAPDALDLAHAVSVDGVTITPAVAEFIEHLTNTYGLGVDRNSLSFIGGANSAYEGMRLYVFIYSEPKFAGSGTVQNGKLDLDLSKYSGLHQVAIYNSNGELVGKTTVNFDESKISKTIGQIESHYGYAFGLLMFIFAAAIAFSIKRSKN